MCIACVGSTALFNNSHDCVHDANLEKCQRLSADALQVNTNKKEFTNNLSQIDTISRDSLMNKDIVRFDDFSGKPRTKCQ